jgi:membrane associated rhomboid family serine protease
VIPLRDNVPSRRVPLVNYALVLSCVLVFLAQLRGESAGHASLVERYGMIPARVSQPDEPVEILEQRVERTAFGPRVREVWRRAASAAVPPVLTLLTCIFLHGGWLHLIGNLWFLYIFGDNVEDCFGHVRYLIFYLGCGAAASLAHFLFEPSSAVPTIGASGAIAGVMGAYLLLYPHAMVLSLVPVFILLEIVVLPAPLFLGIWFFLQLLQGSFSIGATQASGVAWWAHIGGFAAGFLVCLLMKRLGWLRPRVAQVRPGTDHIGHYPLGRAG